MLDTDENASIHQRLQVYEKHSVLVSTILIALFVLLPIPNDVFFIRDPFVLALAVALRVGSALLMGLYYWAYRTRRLRFLYSLVIPLLAAFALATMVMLDLTRPRDYLFGSVSVFVVVSFYYFMMYSPLPYKIIPALAISAEQIVVLLFYKELSRQGVLSMVIALAAFNVFGICSALVVARLHRSELAQERTLRREMQFKDALVNASFEALLLFRENRIVDCNQAFLELSGLKTLEELRALSLDALLPLTSEQRDRLAAGELVAATLFAPAALPIELRQRGMAMADLEYSCLILRAQSDEEADALRAITYLGDLAVRVDRLPLSKRERQIVLEIVQGRSRLEIAEKLFIAEETVKKHTANVYAKLEVGSKIELIQKLLEG